MIRKERMLAEFLRLVSLDAESFGERAVADHLIDRLKSLGLEVSEDNADELCGMKSDRSAGNIFAVLDGEGEAVLLSSHMDTVKPGIGKKAVVSESGRRGSAPPVMRMAW